METERAGGIVLPGWDSLPDIGLYMDQVVTLTERLFVPRLPKGETTRSMVNNYVKSGLVPRPSGKKYDREHLARLLMVCVLKQALSMESIGRLLDVLCRDGIRAGYERFCSRLAALEEAVGAGHIDMNWEGASPDELALTGGLMAALCTIYTYRLLDETAKEDRT